MPEPRARTRSTSRRFAGRSPLFRNGSGCLASLLLGLVLSTLAAVGDAEVSHAVGTTYYVDVTAGSDSNAGTSAASPWATIEKANAQDLGPGDRLLLRGSQTFPGTLRLTAEDAGTTAEPVVIASYGDGRATIGAGTGKGVSVYNAGGVEVKNLVVSGAGYAAGNRGSGVEIYTDRGNETKLEHVRVENVEASGFGNAGVLLGAWPQDGTKSGFRDVRITNVSAHDNADAGIESFGYFSASAKGWAHEDVYVGRCHTYDNKGIPDKGSHSGNGVVLGDVNGATIERCISHDNGENNNHRGGGPVGIWAWDSNYVIIQHNESYGNKSGTIDGGGFDLDGGVTNSVVQYNYSHDNAGAGYLLYQFSGARPFGGNVVHYNVSENDGRTNLGGIYAGGGVANTQVHNNTIYVGPRASGLPFAAKAEGTSGFRFRNNLFVGVGGVPLVEIPYNQARLVFQGNGYWSGGDAFVIRHGGKTYTSLKRWRNATGQETYRSRATGLSANPRLVDPGNGGTIGDADRLPTLAAYKLRAGSPLVDAGLNLRSLFGLSPGPTDFYGTSIPQGAGYDVGTHEAVEASPNTAPTIGSPHPAPG